MWRDRVTAGSESKINTPCNKKKIKSSIFDNFSVLYILFISIQSGSFLTHPSK